MNRVVKFPDPLEQLYLARRTLRDPQSSALDVSAAIDTLEAKGDGEDKWLCRELRRAMAMETRELTKAEKLTFGYPVKSQAEIDAETERAKMAEFIDNAVKIAAVVLGIPALLIVAAGW